MLDAGQDGADLGGQDGKDEGAGKDYAFAPFAWQEVPEEVSERLCVGALDPEALPDKVYIDCAIEGASFVTEPAAAKDEVVVLAYNILRGFELEAQLALLLESPSVPTPDILLLSEADRGCARTGEENIARRYAEAFGGYYVYATEFVELNDPKHCEHGNAIVSRYPLGNVRQIRHAANKSWYEAGEKRLGGRVAVVADVLIGDRILHLYALHLSSDVLGQHIREAQAQEIVADAADKPFAVIAGGDLNAGLYFVDLQTGQSKETTVKPFTDAGYADAHMSLPYEERKTLDNGFVLDLILTRGAESHSPGLCNAAECEGLSDHYPIWTSIVLP